MPVRTADAPPAERALVLAGAAAALDAGIGPPPPLVRDMVTRWLRPARDLLDVRAQAAAWELGQALSPERAVAEARREIGAESTGAKWVAEAEV